jgi:hypothetical protein
MTAEERRSILETAHRLDAEGEAMRKEARRLRAMVSRSRPFATGTDLSFGRDLCAEAVGEVMPDGKLRITSLRWVKP